MSISTTEMRSHFLHVWSHKSADTLLGWKMFRNDKNDSAGLSASNYNHNGLQTSRGSTLQNIHPNWREKLLISIAPNFNKSFQSIMKKLENLYPLDLINCGYWLHKWSNFSHPMDARDVWIVCFGLCTDYMKNENSPSLLTFLCL